MSVLSLQVNFSGQDRLSPQIKNLVGISEKLVSKYNKLKEAQKSLHQDKALINQFTQQKKALEDQAKQWQDATKKIAELKKAMAQRGTPPTKSQDNELQKAIKNAQRLKEAHDKQNIALQKTRDRLKEAGISVSNLAEHQRKLTAEIEETGAAYQKAQTAMERAEKAQERYKKTQENLAKIGKMATKALAVSHAGLAAMALPIKEYAEAEDAEMTLKVSMMTNKGEVAKEFNDISALAQKLGNKLPGSTAQFQSMMATLVQQGISFKAILGGVGEAAGMLGVTLKMPFDEAAEFAAKLQDATKTAEKDMLSLMDVIQKSYYLGVDKTNMLSGFSKLAAGMKTTRMEGIAGAKAMAPLLVMADQASMSGESAGNAYSKIFKAMMDTAKIKKALKNSGTGISMDFTNGKGEFGGLDNAFAQLEKLKELSTEQRLPILSDMFGNDAETIQALNLLIDKGKAGYDETLQKMEKQASIQQRVNAQLGTLTNLWDAAKGTFSGVMASIGEALAPHLKGLVEWITNLGEKLQAWIKANPQLSATIIKVAAGATLFVAVLSAGALAIVGMLGPIALMIKTISTLGLSFNILSKAGTVFGFLKTALFSVGKAFIMVGHMMLTNPIILAITLVEAIIRIANGENIYIKPDHHTDWIALNLSIVEQNLQSSQICIKKGENP